MYLLNIDISNSPFESREIILLWRSLRKIFLKSTPFTSTKFFISIKFNLNITTFIINIKSKLNMLSKILIKINWRILFKRWSILIKMLKCINTKFKIKILLRRLFIFLFNFFNFFFILYFFLLRFLNILFYYFIVIKFPYLFIIFLYFLLSEIILPSF